MEMRSTGKHIIRSICICLCTLFALLLSEQAFAQPPKSCTIKDGRMYITISKKITESSLDSFITQFNLADLDLQKFVRTNNADSLRKLGWTINVDNKELWIISKMLMPLDNMVNPADRIMVTEKHPTFAERFPPVNNGIAYGYNRFRNKPAFTQQGDSTVIFFVKGHLDRNRMRLSGSFNNWSEEGQPMTKTNEGWIARVKLGPGKYWYKFIEDGNWFVDDDNRNRENDGLGNVNSIFYKTNVVFKLNGFNNSRRVYLSGSFNNWRQSELEMIKTEKGWELPLYLAEGTHTYKFIVDGKWYEDPLNNNKLPDGSGGNNSVLTLGKPHLFKLQGYTDAKRVVLSGTFNGWRGNELYMQKTATGWEFPYVLRAGNYQYKFIVDGKWIPDPGNPPAVNKDDNSYLIIKPNYTFKLRGYPNAKNVFLAGDFNDWSPSIFKMKKEGDLWVFTTHLSVGKHLYKFIVDGNWIIDPSNKLWERNGQGSGNSVIWIDK